MKTFATLALVCAASAGIASATACTGGSFSGISLFENGNNPGSTPTVTCTVNVPVNTYITAVTVNTISDYSNPSTGATVTLSLTNFASTLASLAALAPTPFTLSGTQILSTSSANNADQSVNSITVTFNAAFISQFGTVDAATVNAKDLIGTTGTAGSGCAGPNLGCSGGAFQSGIFVTFADVPTSGVPEPATVAMVGSALLALGFLRRKRT